MSNAAETKDLGYSPGGKFRIEALNLHVPAGAIYGFLGPNGSGKTTTLRLLLGLLRPRSGSITVLGHAMPAASAEVLARVGYVPEAPHFDGTRSIRDLLRFQAAFYPTWDWAAAEALLKQFDLDAARPFGRLSKGQRAKVLMLSAMAQRPELLVLDEPTDGLDPVARRDIMDIIEQGGHGIDKRCFSSACLAGMVTVKYGDRPHDRGWNALLVRLGYRQLVKTVWWSGTAHRIWAKKEMTADEVRSVLGSPNT